MRTEEVDIMLELTSINTGLNRYLMNVIEDIDDMPDEERIVTLETMRQMRSRLWETLAFVEGKIIVSMLNDDTKKLSYRDEEGRSKEAVLKQKTPKCVKKDEEAKLVYERYGFDRHDIGDDVFKVSWTKAKKAMDYSGEKKLVIEDLFKSDGYSIEIKEVRP
jgi:hypothetical protein